MSNAITLTADVIIEYAPGQLILGKRKNDPYKGQWGLPGGKLEGEETIEATAIREVREETGLEIKVTGVIGVYSDAERDPRGRYVSVAFKAVVTGGTLKAGSDAEEVKVVPVDGIGTLAFDHNKIIEDYLRTLCY